MGNPYAKGRWHPSKGISLSQFNPIHGFSVIPTWREVDVSDAEVRVVQMKREHVTQISVSAQDLCV